MTGVGVAIRLIHAGLGGWGTDWEENALPPVREIERVGWVDSFEPTLTRAKERLKLPAGKCFLSLRDAFAKVEAEAVLITAPMFAHVPLAIEALEAGKHVLVEKPFAASVAEARQAVELAREKGLTLMVSQQYRHYPAVRKAAELVAGKAFGPVGTVRLDFRKYSNRARAGTSRAVTAPSSATCAAASRAGEGATPATLCTASPVTTSSRSCSSDGSWPALATTARRKSASAATTVSATWVRTPTAAQ